MRRLILLLFTASISTAAAAADQWEFNLVPYIWAGSMDGRLASSRLPQDISVNVPFRDIFQNLDIGGMVAFEGHKGRLGFLMDGVYIKTSTEGTIPVVGLPAEAGMKTFTGLAAGQYRVVDDPVGTLDLMAGVRYWNIRTSFSYSAPAGAPLPPGMPPSLDFNGKAEWVDAMAGAKAVVQLSRLLSLNAYGMLGGGGSNFSADAMVALGLHLGGSTSLLGYRHLDADYRSGGFVFDGSIHGPALGLGVRF